MIDHLGINCADLAAAAAFYDRVLGVPRHRRLMDFGEAIGYGTDHASFWISAQPPEGPASGPDRTTRAEGMAAIATEVGR